MSRSQIVVFTLAGCVALLLSVIAFKVLGGRATQDVRALNEAGIVLLPESRALPALAMTRENGQQQALNELQGSWTLLFFGYTFCPDICPTTLAQLRQVRSQLSDAQRQRLRVILVSLDPGRDTPAQLKQYLAYFDPTFQGLTGASPAQLKVIAGSVGIPYKEPDTSKPDYTLEHTGNLVIVGPDGRQRGFIRAPFKTAALATQLPLLMQRP